MYYETVEVYLMSGHVANAADPTAYVTLTGNLLNGSKERRNERQDKEIYRN